LKNSVNLQSPEQIMAFKALKKQYPNLSTMDILQKLESGNFNPEEISSIIDTVNSYYKDPNERIFAIKILMELSLKKSEDLLLNYKNDQFLEENYNIGNNQNPLTLEIDAKNIESRKVSGAKNYVENNRAYTTANPQEYLTEETKGTNNQKGVERDVFQNDLRFNKTKDSKGEYLNELLLAEVFKTLGDDKITAKYSDIFRKYSIFGVDDVKTPKKPFEKNEDLQNDLRELINLLKNKTLVADNTDYTFFFDANAKLNQ
jgi:hypothetical protein